MIVKVFDLLNWFLKLGGYRLIINFGFECDVLELFRIDGIFLFIFW